MRIAVQLNGSSMVIDTQKCKTVEHLQKAFKLALETDGCTEDIINEVFGISKEAPKEVEVQSASKAPKPMTNYDFIWDIEKYLKGKYDERYKISPLMIDPQTLGAQIAIMEKTDKGYIRKFDLVVKDRDDQRKDLPEGDMFAHVINYVRNTYCDHRLGVPYMLLGDIVVLIGVLMGTTIDYDEFETLIKDQPKPPEDKNIDCDRYSDLMLNRILTNARKIANNTNDGAQFSKPWLSVLENLCKQASLVNKTQ